MSTLKQDTSSPVVSVVMPAYNCESFIRKAVDSILGQTFRDLELIVIDDGSTDQTLPILQTYGDPRLKILINSKNLGLVNTLNRGIDEATGIYLARMDGDDISVPERIAFQLDYLENFPDTALLTSTATLIDEDGNLRGTWSDDVRHITAKSIRSFLPKNNCLVHPAMMGKRSLFQRYRFNPTQAQAEDYDLWLRIMADGLRIEKIAEPLLLHRILSSSFTRNRQRNVFWKNAGTKWRFTRQAIGRGQLNLFVFQTGFYSATDLVMGLGKFLKNAVISR